jgi:hypothetical protein
MHKQKDRENQLDRAKEVGGGKRKEVIYRLIGAVGGQVQRSLWLEVR